MGYTHYWYSREIPQENWDAIVKCIEHLFEKSPCKIQYEWDNGKPPVAGKSIIRFNGVGDEGHETFYFERKPDENGSIVREDGVFAFCKTARKPYDTVVCAALCIIKHYAGDYVKVRSDGEKSEWAEGIALCKKLFKFGKFPVEKE